MAQLQGDLKPSTGLVAPADAHYTVRNMGGQYDPDWLQRNSGPSTPWHHGAKTA